MKDIRMRILSIATAAALVATTAGIATMASVASAATGGPTVTLSSTVSGSTASSTIPVTATFSEGVTGFASGDISVTNGTVSNFSSTASSTYAFDVNPTAQGTVTVQVPADVASSSASSTGNQASNTLTFNFDTAAPSISGVSVATTSSTATITFTTNESATSRINYGTTTSYGLTSATSTGTTQVITLTGLSASTTYHYQIQATDAAGNTATTSDATFMTAASPLSPAISNVAVSNIASTTATVTWMTDLPSTSQVEFGTTTSYGSTSTLNSSSTISHSVTLTGLQEATLYHFAVISGTGLATSTSADSTFVTQSTASSTPLHLNSVTSDKTSAIADNSYADGWQWTLHLTVPDNENAFRIRFSDWSQSSSTAFAAGGNTRVFSPQSSNASSSSSALNITDNGFDGWIYLTGDTSTSTPGRQIDLVVQVKVPFGTATGSYTTFFTAQSWPSTATSTASTI